MGRDTDRRDALPERRYNGQFTPIHTGAGTIGFPDVFGVFNWGSVSIDPERQVMFVNAS